MIHAFLVALEDDLYLACPPNTNVFAVARPTVTHKVVCTFFHLKISLGLQDYRRKGYALEAQFVSGKYGKDVLKCDYCAARLAIAKSVEMAKKYVSNFD